LKLCIRLWSSPVDFWFFIKSWGVDMTNPIPVHGDPTLVAFCLLHKFMHLQMSNLEPIKSARISLSSSVEILSFGVYWLMKSFLGYWSFCRWNIRLKLSVFLKEDGGVHQKSLTFEFAQSRFWEISFVVIRGLFNEGKIEIYFNF